MHQHGTTYRAHSNTPCTCLACQDFLRPKNARRTHPAACDCHHCQNAETVISSKNAKTGIGSRNVEPQKQPKIYEVYTTIDTETGERHTYCSLVR